MKKIIIKSIAFLFALIISTPVMAGSPYQDALNQYREKHDIVGMEMSIQFPDKTQQTYYSGYTSLTHEKQPGDLNEYGKKIDLLGIGSVSKTFVSGVILMLEQEHKLSIDDTLGEYLPEYPDWANITLKQLMNMTSGVVSYMDTPAYNQAGPETVWTSRQLIQLAYDNHTKNSCGSSSNVCFEPGTSWFYSNTNTLLVGMIIEKILGKPLNEVYKQYFLQQNSKYTQLTNTFYCPKGCSSQILARMVHEYDENVPAKDYTNYNLSWAQAAGGMIYNSTDLIHWANWLFLDKASLHPKQRAELEGLVCMDPTNPALFAKPIDHVSPDCIYGYGLFTLQILLPDNQYAWGYEGNWPGVASLVFVFDNFKEPIIVSIQQGKGKNGTPPADPLAFLTNDIYPLMKDQLNS